MKTKKLRTLYPEITPYASGWLKVDSLHRIYWEESGNPAGIPVVYLHGGPGAGSSPKARRFFDPKHYRIVVFDQRGCGKSLPHAEIRRNTTDHLVSDMEKLREFLGIRKWHVFGGSWGSTLALVYAIRHPRRCLSLILRGIFMMTQGELDWFMNGIGLVFSEAWEKFITFLPEKDRKNPMQAYYKLLNHKNRKIQLAAAKSWSSYEGVCCHLIPPEQEAFDPAFALPIARIEAHYFLKCRFKPDDYILKNTDKIKNIPTVIVHGRYDMVCPFSSAWALSKRLKKSKLVVVPDAGHSASEPGILSALVQATDGFRKIRK